MNQNIDYLNSYGDEAAIYEKACSLYSCYLLTDSGRVDHAPIFEHLALLLQITKHLYIKKLVMSKEEKTLPFEKPSRMEEDFSAGLLKHSDLLFSLDQLLSNLITSNIFAKILSQLHSIKRLQSSTHTTFENLYQACLDKLHIELPDLFLRTFSRSLDTLPSPTQNPDFFLLLLSILYHFFIGSTDWMTQLR